MEKSSLKNAQKPVPAGQLVVWYLVAAIAGCCAWHWGTSAWPVWIFEFAFDVSTFVLALVILLAIFFFWGRSTRKHARLANGDFENFAPWVLGRLQRGVAALLGMATVAALAWMAVGSQNGAKVFLLCLLFAGGLQWCAYCLQVLIATAARSDNAL